MVILQNATEIDKRQIVLIQSIPVLLCSHMHAFVGEYLPLNCILYITVFVIVLLLSNFVHKSKDYSGSFLSCCVTCKRRLRNKDLKLMQIY